jgi:hypothetical protein
MRHGPRNGATPLQVVETPDVFVPGASALVLCTGDGCAVPLSRSAKLLYSRLAERLHVDVEALRLAHQVPRQHVADALRLHT